MTTNRKKQLAVSAIIAITALITLVLLFKKPEPENKVAVKPMFRFEGVTYDQTDTLGRDTKDLEYIGEILYSYDDTTLLLPEDAPDFSSNYIAKGAKLYRDPEGHIVVSENGVTSTYSPPRPDPIP